MEKVFFTTAIPVGGNAGKSMTCELLYLFFHVLDSWPKGCNEIINRF